MLSSSGSAVGSTQAKSLLKKLEDACFEPVCLLLMTFPAGCTIDKEFDVNYEDVLRFYSSSKRAPINISVPPVSDEEDSGRIQDVSIWSRTKKYIYERVQVAYREG